MKVRSSQSRGCWIVLITVLALIAGTTSAQVITWNIGTGNWGSGPNWNPNNVPDSTAKSATFSNGGTVTLDASFTINNLNLSNGTINGAGNLNLAGAGSTWTGGTMGGAGTTAILAGGTLSIPNTGNPTLTARPLTNAGIVNYSPSSYLILNGAGGSLSNLSGGLWDFKNDRAFNVSGAWSFDNQSGATLRKSTLSGTLPFNLPLTNAGTVEVLGGIFSIDQGGSATGTFALAAGSTLRFASNFTLGAGSTFSTTGLLELASGTLTLARGTAFAPATHITLNGGTLTGADDFTTASGITTNWNNTTMSGAGTTKILAGGTLNILNTGNPTLAARPLTNAGVVNYSPSSYLILNGAGGSLSNLSGGLWDFKNDRAFNVTGAWAFDNQSGATLRKSTLSGTLPFNLPLTNAGTVDVLGGIFSIDQGGSSTGAFALAAGSTLKFNSNFTLGAGSTFSTTGLLELASGTLTLARGTAFAPATNITLNGGTLTGADDFTTASGITTNWTNTTMSGAGTTKILAGGTLNILNTGNPTLTARPLTNAGIVNYSPSSYLILNGAGGALTNLSGGLWDFKNDRVFNVTGAWAFDNQSGATLRKSTLSGTLPFNLPLTNAGTVEVLGGIFSLDQGGSSAGAFALAAGSTLRFASNFTLGAGSAITGTGTLQVASGTTTFSGAVANTTAGLSFTGGTANVVTATSISGPIDLTGGTLGGAGTLTAAGPFNWNYGDMTGGGVLNANAGGTWATGNAKYLYAHTVNLDGTTAWTAGPIYTGGGSILAIKPGATFTTDFDSGLYFNLPGTRATLDNQGTFTKSAGTGITEIQAVFNNTGTLDVQSGTLNLSGGGSHSAAATVAVASGAILNFSAGTFTMANGSSFTGAGTFALGGGTLAIAAGTANLANLTSTGGTLSGAGTATLGLLVQTGGSLAIDHFSLNGTGSTWTAGNWNSTAPSTATLSRGATLSLLSGNVHDFDYRAVTNLGTVNWNLGYIRAGHGATFTNAAGATFNDLSTSGYSIHNPFGGTFRFINQGSYTRNAADQTSFIDVPFDNTGAVTLTAGDLQLRAGGTMGSSGTMTTAAGSSLTFTAGYTVANGTSFTGPGTYTLAGGTFDVTGTLTVGTFNQTGGTLAGSNALAGLINWSGGDWNSAIAGTSTTLLATGTLNLNTGSSKDFNRRAVTNEGTVNWNTGYIRSGTGGTFTNAAGATFNDFNPSGYSLHNAYGGTFTFTNHGTYNRNAANSISYLAVPFDNTGRVNVLAGDLQFSAGGTMANTGSIAAATGTNVYFTNGYTIDNGASLSGAGTYWLTGGTMTLTGEIAVGTVNQTGGTLAGTSTLNGIFNWSGGDWNAAAAGFTTTIGTAAILNLHGGSSKDLDFRAVVNRGTVNWNQGYLRGGHGATFTNAVGATFNDLNSSGYSVHNPFGGTFVFANHGTYVRNLAGTTYFDTTFNNSGTVNLAQGDLQIRQGGTMAATSVVNAATGTNFYLTNNYTVLDGATFVGAGNFTQTGGTLTLDGNLKASAFNWLAGNWNVSSATTTTIDKTTVLNLVSGNSKDFDFRSITNQGVVNWTQGYLRAGHGSVFTNAAGATFNDLNTSGYTVHNPFGGTFTFVNDGTYTRSVTGTTGFDTPFNNHGTVNLTQGDLQLRAGGTMSASSIVHAAAGTNLYFTDDYTLAAGAQLVGPGAFTQNGGTLRFTNLRATAFTWQSGDWNGAGTSSLDAGTVLHLTSGNNKDFDARSIVNHGTVNWQLGYLRSGNGGTFTNAAAGTFNDQNIAGYSFYNAFGGAFAFVNQGTYVRNVPGTTNFDAPFNNSGTLTLSLGSIQVRQGGTMSATSVVHAAVGTTLTFTDSYTLLAGSQLTGAGTYTQTGGTLTVETLKASSFTWTSGNWNGAGTSVLDAATVFNIASGNDHDFDARALLNQGIVNWSAGRLRSGHGGSIVNAGTWNDSSGYAFNNDYAGPTATFTNAAGATYLKTAGTSTYFVPFANSGTLRAEGGTLRFENTFTNTGGTLVAAGGAFSFAQALDLGTGALGGSGTITAPSVTAGGTVAPGNSPGQLTLTGNLTLLATSTFLVELAGPTKGVSYDFLSVGGNAALAGNLSVSFLNGFNTSVDAASSFTVLTATTLTGAFTNAAHGQRILSSDGLASFFVNYGAASPFGTGNVVLTSFIPVPEPSTYALLGLGLIAVLVAARRRLNS